MSSRKGMPPAPRWTPEEDAIVREHAPHHTISWDGWAELLPGRTRAAIGVRRGRLGVPCPNPRMSHGRQHRWTRGEERALLRCAALMVAETGHDVYECYRKLRNMEAKRRAGRD